MNSELSNQSAIDQISKWGFTQAEVAELGVVTLHKFNITFGANIMAYTMKDLKFLYSDIINNPNKYKSFVQWLVKRFDKFIELDMPIHVLVGGAKQFMSRGDVDLEKSLEKVSQAMHRYVDTGVITPKMISVTLYYLNLIVR